MNTKLTVSYLKSLEYGVAAYTQYGETVMWAKPYLLFVNVQNDMNFSAAPEKICVLKSDIMKMKIGRNVVQYFTEFVIENVEIQPEIDYFASHFQYSEEEHQVYNRAKEEAKYKKEYDEAQQQKRKVEREAEIAARPEHLRPKSVEYYENIEKHLPKNFVGVIPDLDPNSDEFYENIQNQMFKNKA